METAHPGKGKGPDGDRGERKSGGEFKKKERNLNIHERWVSNVASLEDGIYTLCYFSVFWYLQKHLVFRSAKISGSIQ